MATFRKRANNRWQAIVRYKGIQDSNTFNRKTDAMAWARSVETAIDAGEHLTRKQQKEREAELKAQERIARAEAQTLGELLRKEAETFDRTTEQGRRDSNRMRKIARHEIGLISLIDLTARDFNDFIRDRSAEVCDNSIRLDLAAIGRALGTWKSRGKHKNDKKTPAFMAAKSALAEAETPFPGDGREVRLEEGEFEKLLSASQKDCWELCQFAFVIAIETTMRRSELARLEARHLNLDAANPNAYLPKTKNNSKRTVPLSTRAVAAFREVRRLRPVSGKATVLGVNASYITNAWDRVRSRAGLTHIRWHDLRHEAITRLFEMTDLREAEIKEITGHKSSAMLYRYTHLEGARLAKRLG